MSAETIDEHFEVPPSAEMPRGHVEVDSSVVGVVTTFGEILGVLSGEDGEDRSEMVDGLARSLGELAAGMSKSERARLKMIVHSLGGLVLPVAPGEDGPAIDRQARSERRIVIQRARGRSVLDDPFLPNTRPMVGLERLSAINISLSGIPNFKKGESFSLAADINPALAAQFLKATYGAEKDSQTASQIEALSDFRTLELSMLVVAISRVMPHHPYYGQVKIDHSLTQQLCYLEGKSDEVIAGAKGGETGVDTSSIRRGRNAMIKRLTSMRGILQDALDVTSQDPDLQVIERTNSRDYRFTPIALIWLKAAADLKYDPTHQVITPYAKTSETQVVRPLETTYRPLVDLFAAGLAAEADAKIGREVAIVEAHLAGQNNERIAQTLAIKPSSIKRALDRFAVFLLGSTYSPPSQIETQQAVRAPTPVSMPAAIAPERIDALATLEPHEVRSRLSMDEVAELYRGIEAGAYAQYLLDNGLTQRDPPLIAVDPTELESLVREGHAMCTRLVESNLGLVKSIASRYDISRISRDELIAAGNSGLAEAVWEFEPRRGKPFGAFADTLIRRAILDTFPQANPVVLPRHASEALSRIQKIQSKYSLSDPEKIAEALNAEHPAAYKVTPRIVAAILRAGELAVYLDAPSYRDGDRTIGEEMADLGELPLEDSAINRLVPNESTVNTAKRALAESILENTLPPSIRTMIRLHMGFTDGRSYSIQEVALVLGANETAVRSMLSRGKRLLRGQVAGSEHAEEIWDMLR